MNRETSIRRNHAAVTPETLEALANKGLLRRAAKDLERGEVGAFAMADDGLAVGVGGQRVTLVEAGPAKAVCTCPAPGVCQHILAACLKLMAEPATTTPAGSAREQWLAFSPQELLAAFGLPTLRAGRELGLAHEAQVEETAALTVRFAALNAEVIALPGAGLDGIIVKGPAERRRSQFAAAALWVVRRAAGIDWEPPASAKTTSVPAHRDGVLAATATLIEEAVATGLARLSPSMIDRFEALAVSARTAGLHRLDLVLQRIATQTGDWLHRRPHADLGQIFGELATAFALVHGAPRFAAGTARESYHEVGGLDLMGVAAWPWETPSGYQGLTLLFRDTTNDVWNTWSDARPKAFAGDFSAVSRFTQSGPWDGVESPAQLARSRFRLMNAKRNRWGRLSSSAQTKVLITGPADPSHLPATDDWRELDTGPAIGLRERDPRAAYHLVAPAAWLRQPFDPIAQALVWHLLDTHGSPLELRLAFDELARPAISYLESLGDSDLHGARLLVRCDRLQGRVVARPLALIRTGAVNPLFFANAKAKAPGPIKQAPAPGPADDGEIEEVMPTNPTRLDSATASLAYAAISAVEWLAESGVRARHEQPFERLDELSKQAAQLGLSKLSTLLQPVSSSAAWLRLRWLLGLILAAE